MCDLEKQPFKNFATFSVNFWDVTGFGKILKKLNANFGKILRKEKICENSNKTLEIFCDFEKILSKL